MEEIIDGKLWQACKFFTASLVQHNGRGQILAFAHHRDHAHILHQARLLQAIFYLRERNAFFLDFHNGIGTALEQKTSIIVKIDQVSRRKTFCFKNVARLDIQTTVFGNAHLANFKGSPNRSILGLPISDTARFCATVYFHWPITGEFRGLTRHIFG